MDWSAIIVGFLSLLGTAAGTFGGMKLMTYRIEQLEKKVEKHNNLVERTYQLEQREQQLEDKLEAHEMLYAEKFKVANHRIEDLEKSHGA